MAARTDMALASLLGGLALANAGLGAAHGFAGPVGGMFPAPHGAVCAAFLPHVMAANIRALTERAPDSPTLHRYDEIARILTGDPSARSGWHPLGAGADRAVAHPGARCVRRTGGRRACARGEDAGCVEHEGQPDRVGAGGTDGDSAEGAVELTSDE